MKRYPLLLLSLLITLCYSIIQYNDLPSWYSQDIANYSTGAAWADINQNGYPDLVIANGNDMARQHLVVYFNSPDGLSTEIGWQSEDIDYHGHLAVGDVNKDGYPDVVVSVYLGEDGFGSPGRVKLYLNNQGTLSPNPDWVSADSMYTFSCALGDATGNGYLDLAVATGEMYHNIPDYNRIYHNIDGIFSYLPDWLSDSADISIAVCWGDFDNNYFLDIAFASAGYPNKIYFNDNGVISSTPGWESTDVEGKANSLFIADINNNGYLDLAVSDNSQLATSGHFKIYLNQNGVLTTEPWWTSQFSGYGSGITLTDVTGNGFKDLITGGWWEPVRIYENIGGSFDVQPAWISAVSSVVEKIVLTDSKNRGLETITHSFNSYSNRQLYYLSEHPLRSLNSIYIDNELVDPEDYCYDLEYGWVSLSFVPPSGAGIEINYTYTNVFDIAVSNWGSSESNFLYLFDFDLNDASGLPTNEDLTYLAVYPNPVKRSRLQEITFSYHPGQNKQSYPALTIYNVKGQLIRQLTANLSEYGQYNYQWDGRDNKSRLVSKGVYLIKVDTTTDIITKKIIVY